MSVVIVPNIAGVSEGDIAAVNAGTGLSGGGSSGAVTLNLADTAVTPGSYTSTNLTVDQQGRITAAANGSSGGVTNPLPNNTFLSGRNAADDADIQLVGTDASNNAIFGGNGGGQIAIRNDNGRITLSTNSIIQSQAQAIVLQPSGGSPQNITFSDATNTDFVALVAPNAPGVSSILTLPAGPGTNGQVLSTDGNFPAVLSWIDQSGSGGANTALSNLASVAINTNLEYAGISSWQVKTTDGASTQDIIVTSGAPNVDTDSGGAHLQSGNATGTGNSGLIEVKSGTTEAPAGSSGAVAISTGNGSGVSTGNITAVTGQNDNNGPSIGTGGIQLKSGDHVGVGASCFSGSVVISSGNIVDADDSSNSGVVTISSGNAGAGNSSFSGAVTISTGTGEYQSGDTNIWTGDGAVADAYSGDITLYTGAVTGSGIPGRIKTSSLGIQIATTGDEPAADASTRGMIRFYPGATLVADALKICVKDASDVYSWKTVTLV